MTRRERSTLLVATAVLATATLMHRFAGPAYRSGMTSLENYQARRTLLADTEKLMASLPALEDSARTLKVSVAELAPRILSGQTPAEAIADLSGHLSLIANRQGSRLESVRALPDTGRRAGLARVGVVVVFHTDATGLARWLGSVATHPVSLVAQRVRVAASGGFGPQTEMESLQVELMVSGWYLPRAAKS